MGFFRRVWDKNPGISGKSRVIQKFEINLYHFVFLQKYDEFKSLMNTEFKDNIIAYRSKNPKREDSGILNL